MSQNSWKLFSVCTAIALSAALSANLAVAQPKSKAKAKATTEASDDAPAKVKGRLPAYYKDIVDAKQKEKIYTLQADFNGKIDALEEQIKKLTADRDAAVEGVLSPEQKEKLKKAKDGASAGKKKKPADEASADAAKPAE